MPEVQARVVDQPGDQRRSDGTLQSETAVKAWNVTLGCKADVTWMKCHQCLMLKEITLGLIR